MKKISLALLAIIALVACQKGPASEPELKVNSDQTYTLSAVGGSIEIDIKGNVAWNASSDKSWVSFNANNGLGNYSLTVIVGPNYAKADDVAKVFLTSQMGTTQITINRKGGDGKWDGVARQIVEKSWDNTYHVYSAAELAWLADTSDKYDFASDTIKLMDDIDFNSFAIKGFGVFGGVFDGNGKIVGNVNINSTNQINDGYGNNYITIGLFSVNNGVIKNLIVNGVISFGTITGSSSRGGLVAENKGRIMNCQVDVDFSGSSCEYAGGVVGSNSGRIEGCHNLGNVKSDRYAGGVAGSNVGVVENCVNFGEIKGEYAVGGLIGLQSRGEILGSRNDGKVSGGSNVGGIVGDASNGSTVRVKKCVNNAEVGSGVAVGGIVGCYSGNGTCVIEESVNRGKILSGDYAGGIIADSFGQIEILLCVNYADVGGKNNVGGIVGWMRNGGKVVGSINKGSIAGSNLDIGGVVGKMEHDCSVSQCANVGNVSGQTTDATNVGGIVGGSVISNIGAVIIENCYNTATIMTRADYGVAGICGRNQYGLILNCYSIGSIKGSPDFDPISYTYGNGVYEGPLEKNIYYLKTATVNSGADDGSLGYSEARDVDGFVMFENWDPDVWELGENLASINGVTRRPLLKNVKE